MKIPLTLLCIFAVLVLCLPLVAVDSGIPRASLPQAAQNPQPAQATQAPQTAQNPQPAQPAQTPAGAEHPEQAQSGQAAAQSAGGTAALELELPDSFQILNTATGRVQSVKRGDYVRGAVCAEMPPSFHTQALVAQAVAAHTYALRCHYNQQRSPEAALKGADFSADPDNWRGYVTEKQAQERFGGLFEEYWGKLSAAADEGAKYVLVYGEEPIVAAYHSISAGNTEAAANVWVGEAPYLAPVESFGDTLAPNYETQVELAQGKVRKALLARDAALALGDDPAAWLEVASRSPSGYALAVEAGGSMFTGLEIRELFGLRSSDFDVAYSNGTFTFTVRGYGHGVGLSQYGADYMARQGDSFQEILLHYYTNCTLADAGEAPLLR